MPQDEKNVLKSSIDKALADAKHPDASRNLLSLLFPKLEPVLGVNRPLRREEAADRKRAHRISQREFAQTYFGLTPDTLSWGRQELKDILDLGAAEAMQKVEKRVSIAPDMDRPRLRRQFLDALEGAFGAERPFTGEWLLSLADYSPAYLRAGDVTPILLYYTDNTQRIRKAVFVALNAQEPEFRGEVFEFAITQASELSLLCAFFRTTVGDKNPSGVKNREPAFFGSRTERIRNLLLDRIKNLAMTGFFWSQASPGDLLWFWWGCDVNDVREFTTKAIGEEEGFRGLLVVPIHRVYSTAGDYDTISLEWSKIVDLDLLEQKARGIAQSEAGDLRDLADRFLGALEQGRNDPFFN